MLAGGFKSRTGDVGVIEGILGGTIRAVVFDAVGTLIHPQPSAADIYAEVGRRYGSRLTPEVIRSRFAEAFRQQEQHDRQAGWRTSEEREQQRWRAIVSAVLTDAADPEACFVELFAHFARPDAWRCAPDLRPTLAALARKGYRLGLASNYDARLHLVLAGLALPISQAAVVVSSAIGWRKPAPAFFEAVCRILGLPPDAILFVGDDPVNDYTGARQAGLQALLYDPRGKSSLPTTARIAHLSELLCRA